MLVNLVLKVWLSVFSPVFHNCGRKKIVTSTRHPHKHFLLWRCTAITKYTNKSSPC